MSGDAGTLLYLYRDCVFRVPDGVQAPKAGSRFFCNHLTVRAGERVLELGAGLGLAAVLAARAGARVVATDILPAAVETIRANAALNGVTIDARLGDCYAPVAGERFDLIASNPPYIASDDPHLQQGDLRFEPATALASGVDGLDDIRRIVAGGGDHLQPGGWLLIEHGWDQGDAIGALFEQAGYIDVQTVQDLEQRDRVTLGRRPA